MPPETLGWYWIQGLGCQARKRGLVAIELVLGDVKPPARFHTRVGFILVLVDHIEYGALYIMYNI